MTTSSVSHASPAPYEEIRPQRIALAGNPNAGKTTLFNALTGLRQKVGNYPGVTVEKKEGRCALPSGREVAILDLPGTYSLAPKSPDEEIARDVLMGLRSDEPVPDAVIIVVDASNLERNLYLATQILELGLPSVIALNMTDVARANGRPVDAARLSRELGVAVIPLVASRGEGVKELCTALESPLSVPAPPALALGTEVQAARDSLAQVVTIQGQDLSQRAREGIALRLLGSDLSPEVVSRQFGTEAGAMLHALRKTPGVSRVAANAREATARYAMLGALSVQIVPPPSREASETLTDRLDAVLTHRVWGLVIFALLGLTMLQAIFVWASYPMEWMSSGLSWVGNLALTHIPDGSLRDLLVEGVLAGVGAVVTFLPQILILFLFLGLLEDTGYMARAAFLMDRMMGRVGLHGRAFIPLLSSFACAIPGITATRTISNPRDRLTTILIAPFMTCSARVPVYILMIGTFIPDRRLLGVVSLRALVMLALYAAGIATAMALAWVFKRTLMKGPTPVLMMEMPPYKIPVWRNTLITMWDRSSQFLKRAGTVIFALSIVLWFLLSYPKVNPADLTLGGTSAPGISPAAGAHRSATHEEDAGGSSEGQIVDEPSQNADTREENALAGAQVRGSYAGRVGRLIEPVIEPLGFNWKIGIGLVGAMAAREVFVSTMGTVYSVGEADQTSLSLKDAMRKDRWPDGRPVWTILTAVSILVYFVLAMQCISTLAVVRRETNSWTWPLFMWAYMTGLAWIMAFLVYQGGRFLGWG